MKEKLKSYEFWVSVASAVMVLLQTISIKIDVPYVNEITMAFLSLLTVTGILKKSGKSAAVATQEPDESQLQEPQDGATTDEESQEGEERDEESADKDADKIDGDGE